MIPFYYKSIQHYTYVLENRLGYYVGLTNNIPRRFQQHTNGECTGSSSLGLPEDLRIVHIWTSQRYSLSSKLERFVHKCQHEHGNDYVMALISSMPTYTQEIQEIIDQVMPTTFIEQQTDLRGLINEQTEGLQILNIGEDSRNLLRTSTINKG